MIQFAYALGAPSPLSVNDFYAGIAGDTVATQTNGTAGAYTPHKGDIVSLNDQGRVSLAKQGVPSGKTNPYVEAAAVLGVCEGSNFQGLAQGGVYAATAANQNDLTKGTIAKVQDNGNAAYHIDLLPGATAPVIGSKYSIVIDPTDGAQLDTSNPSGSTVLFQVLDFIAGAGTVGSGDAIGSFIAADEEITADN